MGNAPPHTDDKRPVGRPRDHQADDRLLDAALRVFGERGWAGLNILRVANAAGVSKSLAYERWSQVADLLVEAAQVLALPPLEEGEDWTVRELLIAEATQQLELYLGPYRKAVMRLSLEQTTTTDPQAQATFDRITRPPVRRLVGRVRDMQAAGALPPWVSATRLLDAIEGSILIHVLVTPDDKLDALRSGARAYVNTVVDEQLRIASVAPVR